MTVSHWMLAAGASPARDDAPLRDIDAVVIGAGIAGLSAALQLRERGLDVCVIERGRLAGATAGASVRNAGFLMRGCADNYAAACEQFGRERAKALWKLTEDNLASLRSLGVQDVPSFQSVPSALLALRDDEFTQLCDSLDLMRADALRVEWIDRTDDTVWSRSSSGGLSPLGALINPDDAAVNPVHVLRLLAERLTSARVVIHECCEVVGLSRAAPGRARVVINTERGRVAARWCLLCTNAYAPLLAPELAGRVMPRRGQMLAVPPMPGVRLAYSYYANHGSEYFRQTSDGSIVFGGFRTYHADREVGYEDFTTPWVQGDLERFASSVLGVSQLPVSARWSGVMGFTPDHLPLVGPITGESPLRPADAPEHGSVWFCGGCTGHGMSMFHRTAQIAADCMIGATHDNPFPIDREIFTQARPHDTPTKNKQSPSN
jgi:gamma-glutamylputrescine oxidase